MLERGRRIRLIHCHHAVRPRFPGNQSVGARLRCRVSISLVGVFESLLSDVGQRRAQHVVHFNRIAGRGFDGLLEFGARALLVTH